MVMTQLLHQSKTKKCGHIYLAGLLYKFFPTDFFFSPSQPHAGGTWPQMIPNNTPNGGKIEDSEAPKSLSLPFLCLQRNKENEKYTTNLYARAFWEGRSGRQSWQHLSVRKWQPPAGSHQANDKHVKAIPITKKKSRRTPLPANYFGCHKGEEHAGRRHKHRR